MPKYYKKKNTRYSKTYDLTGADLIGAETENMYIDYDRGGKWLESFPGFRRLTTISGEVHDIIDIGLGEQGFLVHCGSNLYRCSFTGKQRDTLQTTTICELEDKKCFYYMVGDYICFFAGGYIVTIDKDFTVRKTTKDSDAIYVPTTYVDGEEAEQMNILSYKFKEESNNISSADFAYESAGLKFSITSESARTCAVIGLEDSFDKMVEIPNRKMINGRYYKVTEIAEEAFAGNEEIRQVILGSAVKKICKSAFRGCIYLTTAVMPDGIEIIGDAAFSGCSSLQNIYIGASCKSIAFDAFDNCNSSAKVYLSEGYESFEKCEGIGNLMIYTVYYSTTFSGTSYGIPIYTPAKSITSVTIDGVSVNYATYVSRRIIRIQKSASGDLEGKSVLITGQIDGSVKQSSERGVTFSLFSNLTVDGREEIMSCKGSTTFDGRAFLFSPKSFKNLIFFSSFTREGKTHPLYFGSLDYFTVGRASYDITDVKKEGARLAVAKADEEGGSIFLFLPRGEEKSVAGRSYPLIYTLRNTGIKSDLYEYDSSTIFIGKDDVYRMKYSTSSAIFYPISKGCGEMMRSDLASTVNFTTIGGYLVVIAGSNMYLGDKRLTFTAPGEDMPQFKWLPITEIGSYKGEARQYFYAQTPASGTYVHPNAGMLASGTVYSFADENGETIYYVQSGIRKYRVIPGEEMVGGDLVPISSVVNWGGNIIFATEGGGIFSFNFDKRGLPPQYLYTRDNFDATGFKKSYKNRLHPYFYTRAEHRARYSVSTAIYDGDVPYLTKTDIRGSLTAHLERRSGAYIIFSTREDGRAPESLSGISLGDLYFGELNFEELSFDNEDAEILSIPKKQGKWVKKQITIYTDQQIGPFAIKEVTHGFKIDGRICND